MKWLDRLTRWFTKSVVEPLIGSELPDAQFDVEVPKINPTGPIDIPKVHKPEPIEFDRHDKYVPLKPTHTLKEEQIEDALEYMPESLSPNQQTWALQMIHEGMKHGELWDDIMDELIFDFWEWYRTNYGPGAA